ncbi:hypothetical protein [Nocardiopsis synnemataformans]|uniref:hypothetical protein n=1 Tax=Nocardiopsis synnemataformans TaxID=61305 RepID=UPI003EBA5E4F
MIEPVRERAPMGEQRDVEEAAPQSPANPKQVTDRSRVAIKIRLHPDTKQRVDYWAKRHGLHSANEYITEAVEEKIARENQDYDLPTLESRRLAQILDEVSALSSNVANLERVSITGFEALLGLTRGDNYLLDAETGELNGGGNQT